MVATQSESARQKLEAESFLRRVDAEFPYLKALGWQAVIDTTVQGMKAIGIYHDSVLTEAQFVAGLKHSIDAGLLPKPPAPVPPAPIQPPPPSPEEIAVQAEQQRLAKQREQDEERTGSIRSHAVGLFGSGRVQTGLEYFDVSYPGTARNGGCVS